MMETPLAMILRGTGGIDEPASVTTSIGGITGPYK
jgi:hypothetical protein